MNVRDRIIAAVGRLSDAEMGVLAGRYSALRRLARERGEEHMLPPPPPEDKDPTMQYRAAQASRGVQRLARKASPLRGMSRAARDAMSRDGANQSQQPKPPCTPNT